MDADRFQQRDSRTIHSDFSMGPEMSAGMGAGAALP
jgi:hypothetical protein